jgi:hypothetical protein
LKEPPKKAAAGKIARPTILPALLRIEWQKNLSVAGIVDSLNRQSSR